MTKIFFSIIVWCILSNAVFPKTKYHIGVSTGVVGEYNFTSNQKLGSGALFTFMYQPLNEMGISLSSGLLIWGHGRPDIYNTHAVPITLGVRYFIHKENFTPYILLELEQIYGVHNSNFKEKETMPGIPKPLGNSFIVVSEKLNDIGYSAGIGIQKKMSKKINIDISAVTIIYSKNEDAFHGRFFIGFNYML